MVLAVPCLCADKLGGGEQDKPHNPGFQHGEIKPQNPRLKNPMMVKEAGETPSLTGKFIGDPPGPRMYTKPPTQELAPEGPDLLVGSNRSN